VADLPLRVAYPSCNPASLARDLARALSADGRLVVRSNPTARLLPKTSHVEALPCFERGGSAPELGAELLGQGVTTCAVAGSNIGFSPGCVGDRVAQAESLADAPRRRPDHRHSGRSNSAELEASVGPALRIAASSSPCCDRGWPLTSARSLSEAATVA